MLILLWFPDRKVFCYVMSIQLIGMRPENITVNFKRKRLKAATEVQKYFAREVKWRLTFPVVYSGLLWADCFALLSSEFSDFMTALIFMSLTLQTSFQSHSLYTDLKMHFRHRWEHYFWSRCNDDFLANQPMSSYPSIRCPTFLKAKTMLITMWQLL